MGFSLEQDVLRIDPSSGSETERPHAPSPIDFVDVLASVVFVGVGLTSLILALWPASATRFADDANTLVATARARHPGPDEVLVAGAALEDLIIEEEAWTRAFPDLRFRLVAADTRTQLAADHYWVVARSARRPPPPDGFQEHVLESTSDLVLLDWRRQGTTSTARLSDLMTSATARYRTEQALRPCSAWRFGRLMCGPNEWNYVGVSEVPVANKPELCIWAHPLSGHDLEITFDNVVLGGGLRGRYAMADSAVADPNASPVTFRLLVDGTERVKRVVANRPGWNHFGLSPADLGADEPRRPHTLTFVVSATNDGRRHFCFDGELVPLRDQNNPATPGSP